MDNTTYLLSLSQEWKRLKKTATLEEVQNCCTQHYIQAMTDLLHWRRLHHDHILVPHDVIG